MSESERPASAAAPDPGAVAGRPRLHAVLLAHLDTQWRWTERDSAERFLPATVDANEKLFDRFPGYVLSFEGAYRYQLLQELWPDRFARVRARVAAGRWSAAGAALEAFDANLPAPESIVRQIHYGWRWLERELGSAGRDLLLPDCFGFPASLPTLAAHCGVIGFSTQKLRKGAQLRCAFGVPFAYGVWRGPDGSELLAALDPGEYGVAPERELGDDPAWIERFADLARAGRPRRRMTYFGVGDQGGALAAAAVARLEASVRPAAALDVVIGPSERIYLETTAAERAALPVYEGDLLLHLHASGCYSSRAALKQWNRTNERLARAAEAAALLATRAGRAYPAARLERAWTRFLARQMHDDLTGTSIPAAYRISWNDEAIAANEFAEILLDSLGAVAAGLARRGAGDYLLFNPLGSRSESPVELELAADTPAGPLAAFDGERQALRCQELAPRGGRRRALVGARVPATGAALCRILPAPSGAATPGAPTDAAEAAPSRLANGHLEARFDAAGRLAGLRDLTLDRELLAAPLRLDLLPDRSVRFPAWEIQWRDAAAPPRPVDWRLASIAVVEGGPLRAALRVEREGAGSRWVETWRLAADARHLEATIEIDWRTAATLCKLAFPLAAGSPELLCDLGVGVARRPLASERLWEVPAQRWTALVDDRQGFGVAVCTDGRSGWDHPDPQTVRLTLVHAPQVGRRFRHQARQDFGGHRLRIALAGFPAAELAAGAAALADRFVAPPLAYALSAEPGGARPDSPTAAALLDLGAEGAALQSLKRAEEGERWIVRLRETSGKPRRVTLRSAATILGVEEMDGCERPRDPRLAGDPPAELAGLLGDRVEIDLRPWSLRTLALDLVTPRPEPTPAATVAVDLGGAGRGFTRTGEREPRGFDGRGWSFPLELAPAAIDSTPVPFDLGHLGAGREWRAGDAGTLELPDGFAELWLLGAATSRALAVRFDLDGEPLAARFPGWREPLARAAEWRLGWRLRRRLVPGFARRLPLAWFATHLHDRRGGDRAGERAFLFAVRLPLGGRGGPFRLPVAPDLRLVAATLARRPARPLAEAAPPFDAD